jgi:hypothetical protein
VNYVQEYMSKLTLEQIELGDTFYHEATNLKCVVIGLNLDKKTVRVRDQNNEEFEYFPVELRLPMKSSSIVRRRAY